MRRKRKYNNIKHVLHTKRYDTNQYNTIADTKLLTQNYFNGILSPAMIDRQGNLSKDK